VGWKISRRVSGVAFLRDYRCRDEGKQYDLDKHARLFHGLAPVREQPRPNSTRLTPLNSEEKITI
jgi:hypothetical protein